MENKLKVEYVDIDTIKPYKNNAKLHPKEQIEQIKKSIENFGMNDPIGIWNNEIVEGHGRILACKELGYKQIPVIKLDHLTDEERKSYIIAHNKLTMNSDFDIDILRTELENLKELDFDLELTGFNNEEIDKLLEFNVDYDEFSEDFKENERQRTNNIYNLKLFDEFVCDGKYQMPIINNDNYIPEKLIGFNYAKTSKEKNNGIHFYLDDYQFERVWNNPEEYVDILEEYDCILSPDFSLYLDMPYSMKIWNVFRSRLIGQYYQKQGIKVIPTLSWAEEETFEFCFDGIPEGSIVSVSTIGVKKSSEALKIWKSGMNEMIKRIKPSVILVYGGKLDYDYKDIKVIYYDNEVTERMKKLK